MLPAWPSCSVCRATARPGSMRPCAFDVCCGSAIGSGFFGEVRTTSGRGRITSGSPLTFGAGTFPASTFIPTIRSSAATDAPSIPRQSVGSAATRAETAAATATAAIQSYRGTAATTATGGLVGGNSAVGNGQRAAIENCPTQAITARSTDSAGRIGATRPDG